MDPLSMVGAWLVGGTDEDPGTILHLGGSDLTLWGGCGKVYGSWRADRSGLFVADAGKSLGDRCPTIGFAPQTHGPEWLMDARTFGIVGAARVLLDEDGSVTARLEPVPAGASSPAVPAPVVDQAARAALAPPSAPLPPGLRPATRPASVGRWTPEAEDATRPRAPFLDLRTDGSWSASDGCNGSGGRWTVGTDGRVLATSGLSTMMACTNVPVDRWWARAAWAGFDGDELVLVDDAGAVLGSFSRTNVAG